MLKEGHVNQIDMSGPNYTWNAADYAQHSRSQFDWAQELIAKLGLGGGEALLDLGCGDGRVTATLAARLPAGRVVGVDRSLAMLALARQRFPPAQLPHLHFAQMDAAQLGFAGCFDVVFSNAVLHWVPDHRAVLAGVRRSLRPGGRLLFQMGGRGNGAGILATLARVIEREPWRPYFAGFDFPYAFYAPDNYAAWVPQAELQLVRAELLPKDMAHESPAALAGWIRTTWLPYTERVPAAQRDQLIAEIVDTYLTTHPPAADGNIHVAMVRLEVEARRPA